MQNASSSILGIFGADSTRNLIQESIKRLATDPSMILLLIFVISLCLMGLFSKNQNEKDTPREQKTNISMQFIQILIIMGALLCFIPEFFYLRDQFGWRMNTIFKFYFQGWIIFSLAAAFAIPEIIYRLTTIWKKGISILFVGIIIGTGLFYPFFAIPDKTNSFQNMDWSLDGNHYFKISNPLEYEAISFLDQVSYGVVAEAIGGSYSNYGRVSKFTGLPSVLGWPGHESQWRGGANEIGNRESDIKELYLTSNWNYAWAIMEKYNIHYVFIGLLEKSTYPVSEKKFEDNLVKIFNNSEVTIYEYSPKT